MTGVIIRFKKKPIPVVAVPARSTTSCNDKAGNVCAFWLDNCSKLGAYHTCLDRNIVFRKVER